VVGLLATGALVGWWLHMPVLQSAIPGFVAMNPATALAFLLAAGSLLSFHGRRADAGSVWLARMLAACAVVVPLLCVSRFLTPWDFGLDRLLFPSRVAVPLQGFPNRMAPVAAGNFVVAGIALLLLASRSRRVRRAALVLSVVVGFVGLVVIVDYGYESSLAEVQGLIPVALNTAVAFVLLAVAMLCARPADGVASLFLSGTLGGDLARRLLPAALIVPLLIGWAEWRGQDLGWYDRAGGTALVAILTTLILAALIWMSARSVDRADRARSMAERELQDLNLHLEERVLHRTGELKQTHEQARRAADELRGWFDASPLASCSLTPDNQVLSWNPAAETMFGWTADEVIGQQLPIIPDDLHDESKALTEQALAGEQITNLEARRRHKDGRLLDVAISTASLHEASGAARAIVAVYADIGDRKRLELQLAQSQKMEAVGRLAGGVAHDFNNILVVVQAAAEFLLDDLDKDDARRSDAVDIADAARRAASLTRQLLAFSRQQVLELRVLDVNGVVDALEPMLRRVVEANIELVFRPAGDLGFVMADAGQLDQVLVNLVVNARDAMPGGGTILIETSNVILDDAFPQAHLTAQPGPHVLLSITDTGAGMDAETQARLFEPFFTTKAMGKGTGLGLATVYGIIKQLGGHIWVYSEVDHGTTFKIYLPRHAGAGTDQAGQQMERCDPAPTGATILLVEDDATVRATVRKLLERHDYRVLEAANGNEALALIDKKPGAIDLVLSDTMMAGMSGVELRQHINERPASPLVLLMSGYSEEALIRLGATGAPGPVIQKPFTVKDIIARIDQVLRSAPA
jgi:two-component system cell cycle sensor histidine kinase/response regulator CckA